MALRLNQDGLFRQFHRKAREVWRDAKPEEIEAALAKAIFDHCDHPPKPRKPRDVARIEKGNSLEWHPPLNRKSVLLA